MKDVIVIGAGHAGLYSAKELAELGFEVQILEQKEVIGEKVVCTGIVSREAFEEFELPEETMIGKVQDLRFVSPQNRTLDYFPKDPLAFVVNRKEFNQALMQNALDQGV